MGVNGSLTQRLALDLDDFHGSPQCHQRICLYDCEPSSRPADVLERLPSIRNLNRLSGLHRPIAVQPPPPRRHPK
jgi:hypothetical protein